jgi:CHAT domain-containing protein/Tfp pilus assembly protein PilF
MTKALHRKAGLFLGLVAAVAAARPAAGQAPAPEPRTGIVVERAAAGSAGAKAGLRPGDEILAWSAVDAHGPVGGWIGSPFGLSLVEWTYAPKSDVLLSGLREGRPVTWLLSFGTWWKVVARPALRPELAALYEKGREKMNDNDLDGGEALWKSVADTLAAEGDAAGSAWVSWNTAEAFSRARRWPDADAAYERALSVLAGGSDLFSQVRILSSWGSSAVQRSAWDRALDLLKRSLDLQRQVVPRNGKEANILSALGEMAWLKGDLATAEGFLRRSIKAYEELGIEGSDMAGALNDLGNVETDQGDLDLAEENLRQAEEILQRLDPGSYLHGATFTNLGNVMFFRADLAEAERLFRRALEIFERLDPESDEVLRNLNNLADIAEARGDLAGGEDLLLRALRLVEKPGDDSMALAEVLESLAHVAQDRGDLAVAERRLRRSLSIAEVKVPGSPKLAQMLQSFAILERRRGNLQTARDALLRAVAIQERQAPGSFHVAEARLQLANVELAAGDPSSAEAGFQRARAFLESQVPDSPALAEALRGLGNVAARRRQWRPAIDLYLQALRQLEKTGTGTAAEAQILHALGKTERSAGLKGPSREHLCGALDALDRQRRKLGGAEEARTAFEASHRDLYDSCLEALLTEGRSDEAFSILERGRARAFLDLLAERDLEVTGLSPETAEERRRLNAEYDRLQSKILAPPPGTTAGTLEDLRGKLRDVNARQDELAARIRRESPRFASLQYPEPLSLAGARAALDPGTVLLEYVVQPRRSWLLVVQPADAPGPGLSVFRIAAGEGSLRREVENLRHLLRRPGSNRAALQASARRLYERLVRPAEGRIAQARRILVSPDGPLRTVPFAALMRGDRYLVEWKAVHSTLSATVYAEIRRSRPGEADPREERLAAFGAPLYPRPGAGAAADPEVRGLLRRGWAFTPLPSTRKEVQAIATLYPQGHAYLGREATEEKAKALGPDSRLIHFACHGLLDERFPLNSALALTLPEHPVEGQENGLLQAWEIFESLHLDADLVTLSACDTALGKEMGGEGLVGLTRAFEYAGARSVLASLWGVADYATARFMARFYRYLRDGKPKDEALRAAQLDQIRQKGGTSHPFFWAAFELNGDWR